MSKLLAFSLIELMVVIAIVAVLSAVAVPAYKDYVVRAKIGTVFGYVVAAKKNIEDFYNKNGYFPPSSAVATYDHMSADPNINAVLYRGCTQSNAHMFAVGLRDNVTGVANPNGFGEITGGNGFSFVVVENNGVLTWYCRGGGNPTIDAKYVPSNCFTDSVFTGSVCTAIGQPEVTP